MSGCPTPEELSRAFDRGGDAALGRHLEHCDACSEGWRAMRRLRRDAQALAATAPAPDTAAARARLLDAAPGGAPARRWIGIGGLAAAAAAGIVLALTWPNSETDPSTDASPSATLGTTLRTTLHPTPGADVTRLGAQPDEVVRLRDGELTVECAPLAAGERFRVVLGDAVVEVRGTAFDVVASEDRLVSVYVIRGVVDVRPATGPTVTLREGERWLRPANDPVDAGLAMSADADGVAPPARRPARVAAPAPSRARPTGAGGHDADGALGSHAPDAATVPADAAPPPDAAPPRAEYAFTRGWAALTAGRADDAAADFAEVQRAFPDDPLAEDAAFWRVVALGRADRVPAAVAAARRFLERWPASGHRSEAALLLAGWLHARGDHGGARTAYQIAARARDPAIRRRAELGLRGLPDE